MSVKFTSKGLADGADDTKELKFNVSGVTTGTTRTITVPNGDTKLYTGDGTSGQILTSNGAGTAPTFQAAAGGGDNTPSFSVSRGNPQSISHAVWVKVMYNTESWDSDSAFASTTNYRFTVPSGKAGKYLFTAGIGFNGIGDGVTVKQRFKKNGSFYNQGYFNLQSGSASDGEFITTHTLIISLADGDYIENFVSQADGVSNNVYAGTSYLAGFRLAGV